MGFHTLPQAVKYPETEEQSEMHGILSAEILSESTVRASPIQRKPRGSESSHNISAAAVPKNAPYSIQRRMALLMPHTLSAPSSSATRRVDAKRIPEMAKVAPRFVTEETS